MGMGGTEKTSVKLINQLHYLGLTVSLINLSNGSRFDIQDFGIDHKIQIFNLNDGTWIYKIVKARQIVRDFEPDIIEGMLNLGNIFQALVKSKRSRTVYNIRSVPKNVVRNPLLYIITKFAQIRSDVIITNSAHLSKYVLPRKKHLAISNPMPTIKCKLHTEVQIKTGIKVLTVANLRNQKGLLHYLRLINKLDPQLQKQFKFYIAGSGNLKDSLQNFIEENNIPVILMGYRADIENEYQDYDLYIHPSKKEGSPNALLAAISSTLPLMSRNADYAVDLDISTKFLYSNFKEFQNILKLFLKDNEIFISETQRIQSTLSENTLGFVTSQRIKMYENLLNH